MNKIILSLTLVVAVSANLHGAIPAPLVPASSNQESAKSKQEPRLKIEIFKEKEFRLESVPITLEQLTAIAKMAREIQPKVRLHLRVEKKVPVRSVKAAVKAAAAAGITDVLFSSFSGSPKPTGEETP